MPSEAARPPDVPRPARSRALHGRLALVTIVLGLASRRFGGALPVFVAQYAGDVLWATMVFWICTIVLPRAQTRLLAGVALMIAFAVEFSQLHRAPWLDALRATSVGALALGQGFLVSDLACYAVGVALGVAIDALLRRRTGIESARRRA